MISKKTIDEVKAVAHEMRPYYRIMLRNGELIICELQPFDECDYDESEWITDHKFYDVEESYVERLIQAVHHFIEGELVYIFFDDERQNIAEEIYDKILSRAMKENGKNKLKKMFDDK
jgi:hypothetical protein